MGSGPDRSKRIQQLFLQVVELPEPQRAGFLASQCSGEPELLVELESLLRFAAADTAKDGFVTGAVSAQVMDAAPRRRLGRLILDAAGNATRGPSGSATGRGARHHLPNALGRHRGSLLILLALAGLFMAGRLATGQRPRARDAPPQPPLPGAPEFGWSADEIAYVPGSVPSGQGSVDSASRSLPRAPVRSSRGLEWEE